MPCIDIPPPNFFSVSNLLNDSVICHKIFFIFCTCSVISDLTDRRESGGEGEGSAEYVYDKTSLKKSQDSNHSSATLPRMKRQKKPLYEVMSYTFGEGSMLSKNYLSQQIQML